MNETHTRDGGRCVGCGERANTVQHRIHGNRGDNRPSNLLSACMGPGTRDCHSWMESHRAQARAWGWEVSKHGQDPARVAVWMENGIEGRGWYLLDDEWGQPKLVEPSNVPGPLAPRGARR